jgi:glycerol kinase
MLTADILTRREPRVDVRQPPEATWHESRRWEPTWSADRRVAGYAGWKKAVDRALNWVDVG